MITYLVSISLFLAQFTFSQIVGKKIIKYHKNTKEIRKQITKITEEEEKEYETKPQHNTRLRILELFSKIKDEDKKEEYRLKMIEAVKINKGKPNYLLLLHLLRLVFSVSMIYILILLFKTEPVLWLSISLNILVISFWISRKRYLFSIIFGLIGFFLYPHIPSHIVCYLFLNFIYLFISQYWPKKNKKG